MHKWARAGQALPRQRGTTSGLLAGARVREAAHTIHPPQCTRHPRLRVRAAPPARLELPDGLIEELAGRFDNLRTRGHGECVKKGRMRHADAGSGGQGVVAVKPVANWHCERCAAGPRVLGKKVIW